MSKIKLEAPFRQFRGKICKHSQIQCRALISEAAHNLLTFISELN